MKTVFLLRHAKSSWDRPNIPDFERPLAPRGRKAAPRMGKFMAREGLEPQRVLCSSARRALETWELVSEQLDHAPEVEIREDLYHASPESLLAMIQGLPAPEDSVLLVGHNPTFEDLALGLLGTGEEKALTDLRRKYPTAALCVLHFPTRQWSQVEWGEGHLDRFVRPKKLKS